MDRRASGTRRAPDRPVGDRGDRKRARRRLRANPSAPAGGGDLELGYQLAPWAWGHGFAAEAGHALAHYAFNNGEEEVFAVVRPRNERGVRAARRIGMEWVGETDKYYDLRLQVFRLRKADLDTSALEPGPVER